MELISIQEYCIAFVVVLMHEIIFSFAFMISFSLMSTSVSQHVKGMMTMHTCSSLLIVEAVVLNVQKRERKGHFKSDHLCSRKKSLLRSRCLCTTKTQEVVCSTSVLYVSPWVSACSRTMRAKRELELISNF